MENVMLSMIFTLHLGFENAYNNFHPHIRYEDGRYIAGAYYNSESAISLYIAKSIEFSLFSVELGAVTGYSNNIILPLLRFVYDINDITSVFVLPGYEYNNGPAVVLGIEYKF